MTFPSAFADDDYCYLTTTGRKSGEPREIEIWFALDGASLYLLAGGRDRSHWVRNAIAEPRVQVRIREQTLDGRAEVLGASREERRARDLVFEKYRARHHNDLEGWRESALPVAIRFGP